jgi:hypothetical protein
MFFTHSCGLILGMPDRTESVSVEIINQTTEDVSIYSYDDITWVFTVEETVVKSKKNVLINIWVGKKYYAKGISLNKSYGEFSVSSSSSYWDVIWVIKE